MLPVNVAAEKSRLRRLLEEAQVRSVCAWCREVLKAKRVAGMLLVSVAAGKSRLRRLLGEAQVRIGMLEHRWAMFCFCMGLHGEEG